MSFDRVRYQPAAVRLLRAAAAAGRLAHAYLFVGPRGVGKALAARELAKLLFCKSRRADPPSADPCDQCDSCRRVDAGTHPDLYWFRKEADRNDFRINLVVRGRGDDSDTPTITVTESVALKPMDADCTVTVLDDAERLNREAANALLKTLEEPSSHAVLILLCADASQLPGTILSRCQWVRFVPLPEEFVAEKVRALLSVRPAESRTRVKGAEPPGRVSDEEILFVSRFAGGSIEQALALTGSGLWDLKRDLVAKLPDIDPAIALDMAETIQDWARTWAKQQRAKWDTPEGNMVRRTASRLALAVVASALGDAAILAAGDRQARALIHADQPQTLDALARWPAETLARAVDVLAEAQAQIGRYVHVELATENALIQFSRLVGR